MLIRKFGFYFTLPLFMIFFFCTGAVQAQQLPASGKWTEYIYQAAAGWGYVYDKDPVALCKKSYTSGPAEIYYYGSRFVKFEFSEPGSSITGFCYSSKPSGNTTNLPNTPVRRLCAIYNIVDGVKTREANASYTLCQPPCDKCAVTAGNPVEVANFTKVTNAVDWVSPIDSRFKIERHYRSDGAFLARYEGKGERSSSRHEFGVVWQRTYSDARMSSSVIKNPYDPADTRGWVVLDYPDGRKAYFNLSFPGSSVVINDSIGGEGFTSPSVSGALSLVDPLGVNRVFAGSGGALASVTWPDGYKISTSYDGSGIIYGMSDNKGNKVSFVFDQNVVPGANRQTISEIIIYRLIAGVYTETGRLKYGYTTPVFPLIALDSNGNAIVSSASTSDPKTPMLTSVDYLAADSTVPSIVWRYTYATSLPVGELLPDGTHTATQSASVALPLLTSISDGGSVPYAEYTYKDYGYENITAIGSDFRRRYLGIGIATEKYAGDIQPTVFDKAGASVHTMTNPLGLTTTYTFLEGQWHKKASGIATASTPATLPSSRSTTYGALDYTAEIVNRNAAKTTYTRDAKGRILTMTEDATGASPRVTAYTWPPNLRLPLTRTTEGLAETFTYDSAGLLLTYTQTDTKTGSPTLNQTRTWTYGYTTLANGLKVLTTLNGPGLPADGINDVTTYTYTATGDLTTATDPNGLVTTVLARNVNGQPTLVEQPDLSRWSFTYDYEGRVLTAGFAGPGQTALLSTFTYNQSGQVLTYTNSRAKTWTFTYNDARRLTETTGPTGDKITYTYDAAGNVTKEEYRNGTSPVTFWEGTDFDALGRVLRTLGAMGQTWSYANDVEDNLTGITDPLTNTTTHAYDKLNRLITTVDRENYSTGMLYDAQDRLVEYTDPRTIQTLFTRNGFGEVVSEVSADRGSIAYTYDRRGLVKTRTDARGITVTYAYDNAGRLTLIDYPTGTLPDITFTHDTAFLGVPANSNKGRVGRISDGIISTEFGQEVTASGPRITATASYPGGRVYTVTEETDFEGNPTRTVYPSGKEILFDVDDANRLTRIRVKDGSTFTTLLDQISYAPNGPMLSVLYSDGYTQTRTYDLSYRLTGIKDALGATSLRDVTMGYEGRDNLASITDAITAGNSETFTYTARESLSGATGAYGGLSYTYDGVGNRLTASVGAATDTYTYPGTSNQLSMINLATGGSRGFIYDASGNVVAEARPGGTYSYTYSAAGRMETFSINGILQASYKYDAMGRQAIRTLTSPTPVTIHSVFDSEGRRIAEYDETSGALIREYVWNGWEPVAVIEGGVISFVRADHIGRPVFATNAAGTKVWSATYNPFGGVHVSTGTLPSARFPGQWFQSESGLHQNWMRDYDPATGRYLQADPLGLVDGASVYGYVKGNPMRHVDPKGEQLAGVVGGWVAGDATIPDPTDAAWPKWVTYGAVLGGAMILDYCTSCPACSPYPAGTVGYIGPHTNHTHYPHKDHYNLSRVLQDPNTCKCYWRKNKPDSAPYPPPADPSWVDLNPGFPVLSP